MAIEKDLQERIDILELESLQLSKVLTLCAVLAAVLVTSIVIFSKWGHVRERKEIKETLGGTKNGNGE